MKSTLLLFFLLCSASCALAYEFVSSEDRSRFDSRSYKTVEPGLLAPSAYIEMAKIALHRQLKGVHLNLYSDPVVSRRSYHDAPPKDRDVICVQFVSQEPLNEGGYISRGLIASYGGGVMPAILVLIRRDLSKIYVNVITYRIQ